MGNTRKEFGEDRTCSSEDMIANRQTHTDRHAHHNTARVTTVSQDDAEASDDDRPQSNQNEQVSWTSLLSDQNLRGPRARNVIIANKKTGNVTFAGWQVTLCDPIWHVSCCKR